MKSILSLFCAILFLNGCYIFYPNTQVKVHETRPAIAIKDASSDAVLFVDGLGMGKAEKYNGKPHVLLLEPGKHRIVLKEHDAAVFDKIVFLGENEVKTIVIGQSINP